ncbi:MAG: hypothetical protein GX053_12775 [Tissierella sp.]|nr:hypothetical protein [Tissierella sp.]
MIKKIKFYLECIKIVWNDRHSKNCRQKWRRLSREFEKKSRELGVSE